MSFFSKKEYKFIEFRKSKAKHKMYAAILQNKKTGRTHTVNFGDKRYQNYQDKTGLNLYPHLIHGDPERRKRYRQRHKKDLRAGYYSAGRFSWKILW
jgi:hypothetical protein